MDAACINAARAPRTLGDEQALLLQDFQSRFHRLVVYVQLRRQLMDARHHTAKTPPGDFRAQVVRRLLGGGERAEERHGRTLP